MWKPHMHQLFQKSSASWTQKAKVDYVQFYTGDHTHVRNGRACEWTLLVTCDQHWFSLIMLVHSPLIYLCTLLFALPSPSNSSWYLVVRGYLLSLHPISVVKFAPVVHVYLYEWYLVLSKFLPVKNYPLMRYGICSHIYVPGLHIEVYTVFTTCSPLHEQMKGTYRAIYAIHCPVVRVPHCPVVQTTLDN